MLEGLYFPESSRASCHPTDYRRAVQGQDRQVSQGLAMRSRREIFFGRDQFLECCAGFFQRGRLSTQPDWKTYRTE